MLFSKSDKMKELVGKHTDQVMTCYKKYAIAMKDILDGCDCRTIEAYTNTLRIEESKADEIRRQIIRQMLEGGLVVDSRKSIMHVIEAVDGVADLAEDIVQEIYIQNMQLPVHTEAAIRAMIDITEKQLGLLISIVKGVVDRYKAEEMTQIILQIEGMESAVDDLQQNLVKDIFGSDFGLAEKMQLREIINMIGHMSDIIEDISDEIEIIMMARKV